MTRSHRSALLAHEFDRIDHEPYTVGSWRDDSEYTPPTPRWADAGNGVKINLNVDWQRYAWLHPDDNA